MTDQTDDPEKCGYETSDGSPCEQPACRDDGRCWIHTEEDTDDGDQGRPSKLSKERADRICSHIAEGKSVVSAARMERVNPATVYNWLDRVDPEAVPPDPNYGDDPFEYFFDRFTHAKGLGEDAYVSDVMRLARDEGDLSTLLSMLKQRYPESWGDIDRGEQAGGVVVNVSEPEEHEIDPDTLEVQ